MNEFTEYTAWGEIIVRLPCEILLPISVPTQRQERNAYDISRNTQDVDKRPVGPAAGPDSLVDDPRNRDYSFAYNNQCKKAHTHIKVSILKPNPLGNARQPHNDPHFQTKQHKPNGPYVGSELVAS